MQQRAGLILAKHQRHTRWVGPGHPALRPQVVHHGVGHAQSPTVDAGAAHGLPPSASPKHRNGTAPLRGRLQRSGQRQWLARSKAKAGSDGRGWKMGPTRGRAGRLLWTRGIRVPLGYQRGVARKVGQWSTASSPDSKSCLQGPDTRGRVPGSPLDT